MGSSTPTSGLACLEVLVKELAEISAKKMEVNLQRLLAERQNELEEMVKEGCNYGHAKDVLCALMLEEIRQWTPPYSQPSISSRSESSRATRDHVKTIKRLYQAL